MFAVLSSFISFFFSMMTPDTFFGYAFLIVAVIASIGLMISTIRRSITR
jgi:hypothetical protein